MHLDLVDARRAPALAVERDRRLNFMTLCSFLDPLVDPSEDLLVACRAIGEIHNTIYAHCDRS
jgi:hypothetical protein